VNSEEKQQSGQTPRPRVVQTGGSSGVYEGARKKRRAGLAQEERLRLSEDLGKDGGRQTDSQRMGGVPQKGGADATTAAELRGSRRVRVKGIPSMSHQRAVPSLSTNQRTEAPWEDGGGGKGGGEVGREIQRRSQREPVSSEGRTCSVR